jgi:hypothetical protein
MVLRIGCKQQLHIGKILLARLDGLIVALQADIEAVSKEHASLLCCMRVVTVHTGGILCDRRVFDSGSLVILNDFLVTFPTKIRGLSL